ncbi:response regulator [Pseudobacter ginsenosidimutans]|jgi:DNA-binding NarL/FixJ family response regulator|uniref:LuxR family two component transcriptional regulator n=1 Tax=Pseudobacter ginsenosidimutans TaxID=661488 RepID=A0A4Q7MSZ6_9BACT|nr:response regulator transcription factor [Pseudobacter ginsenosidimutans]QEC41491.1 response regulator transcription factor [Pseudobacter ginsenosidimutans]RZS71727.1 LuxR family two component transcriptional regulator [Pseudobacter ginsenosidimutans]
MAETRYITIVDDHAMFRKGLAVLINMFPGYKVLFDASNGKDFIKQLKAPHLPDIVLLDISMPEMDGYATADWIRVNHPGICILALSTMDSETAIIKMVRHGAKGYILKDADPAELQLAFNEILSKGFYYNDAVTDLVLQAAGHLLNNHQGASSPDKLTEREIIFIRHACSEKSYMEIARDLQVSERTVDGYRESVFKKLKVNTRIGMVLFAIRAGMVKI